MDRNERALGLLFRNGRKLFGVTAVALAFWGTSAQAAFFTWANAGTAWNTTTGANWVGGAAPANSTTTGTAVFDSNGTAVNPNVTTAISIGALNYLAGAFSYTMSGAALNIGAGGITSDASVVEVFSNSVSISSTGEAWTVNSGTLRFTNTVDLNNNGASSRNLNLSGTGVKLLEGTVQNSAGGSTGSLILTDPGAGLNVVTLSGSNSYTGNTTLNARTQLNINNAAAVGTSSLSVGGAATIDNSSSNAISLINNNNITLTTSGTLTFLGTKDLSFGSNTVTVSGGNRDIVVNAGKLSIGNIVGDTTARRLSVEGSGTLAITGTSNLTTGGITLNSGALELDNANALGGSAFIFNGGTLTAASTLNHTGTAQTSLGGDAAISGPDMTFAGGLFITAGTGTTRTLTVNNTTTYSGSNTTAAVGSFAKSGTGTLILAGATGWTGTTFVNSGTLAMGASNVLTSTSKLNVNGGSYDTGAFNTTVSAVTLASGLIAGTSSGTIVSTTAYAVQSGTISAGLSGTSALNKTTAGTVVLSGNNTYSGTTTVSAGTLVVAGGGSITSNTVVSAGVLEVKGTLTGNVSVTGTVGGSGSINGMVSGSGLFAPGDPQITTVTQINPTGGLDFGFQFTGTAPNYSSATASINDLIRLTGATPFTASLTSANTVTIDFSSISLVNGQSYAGAFFSTQSAASLLASLSGASFSYTGLSNGITGFTLSTQAVTDPFGGGTSGSIAVFTAVVPEPQTWTLMGLSLAAMLIFRRRRVI